MEIVADIHVHLYPDQSAALAFGSAFENLSHLGSGGETVKALCLTERFDCSFFAGLTSGSITLAQYQVEPSPEADAVWIVREDGARLLLLPGRQITTQERIEVLALTKDLQLKDQEPIEKTLAACKEAGAIPVINWAPGKWFFERGRIVASLIEKASPGDFFLGDTSLRPTLWPTPRLMKEGLAHGLRLLAGSDPLPFLGEELLVGSYGINLQGEFDLARPASSFRAAVLNPETTINLVGRRSGVKELLYRLRENQKVRVY